MIQSGRTASPPPRLTAVVVTLAAMMSLFGGPVSAQVRVNSAAAQVGAADASGIAPELDAAVREQRRVLPIRMSLGSVDYRAFARPAVTDASPRPAPGRSRPVARKIIGGAIGAAAGFFTGGYLGAAVEGDRCHCDDPGLRGALIGAPVGAVAGGILGALFF